MARAISEIYKEIQEIQQLSEEKVELLRTLVADLDAPADAGVEKAWLEEAHRRYQEIAAGKVKGVSGPVQQRGLVRIITNQFRRG